MIHGYEEVLVVGGWWWWWKKVDYGSGWWLRIRPPGARGAMTGRDWMRDGRCRSILQRRQVVVGCQIELREQHNNSGIASRRVVLHDKGRILKISPWWNNCRSPEEIGCKDFVPAFHLRKYFSSGQTVEHPALLF